MLKWLGVILIFSGVIGLIGYGFMQPVHLTDKLQTTGDTIINSLGNPQNIADPFDNSMGMIKTAEWLVPVMLIGIGFLLVCFG